MRSWILAGAGLLLALGIGGCSAVPEEVHLTRGFADPGTPYGAALARYTRYAELYNGLDTVAKGWATWRSPELREALVESSIAAYRLGPEEAGRLRAEEERAARRVREFHLALYTPAKDWNDLESPDTLWKLSLELPDGTRLVPLQVVHIPKTAKVPVEYPYVSPWTREYTLFFPLLGGRETHRSLTLVLSGPLGTMRFRFGPQPPGNDG